MQGQTTNCVLGIDLGTNSVGWSLVNLNHDGNPCGIEAMGVRVFEAGVEGDIEQGKDSSRAAGRREKRAARRMLDRRRRRMKKVFGVLQRAGLLPDGKSASPQDRDVLLKALDAELGRKWVQAGDRVGAHLLAYKLRAAAVQGPVDKYELGRALYHLAQRRGFRSNRKADRKDNESGVVKQGISELEKLMQAAGCNYLGEYFATLDPEQRRLRQRWTSREMYQAEFAKIVEVQKAGLGDVLTEEAVKRLHRAIFWQRPLKSQRNLIGECELEPGKKKAPLALPVAQRFRLLAAANNLEIYEPSGACRMLTAEEREKVVHALEHEGDLTFTALRKLLGFPKPKGTKGEARPGYEFNLEREGGEDRLCGNRTACKLRPIFGDRWSQLPATEQEAIVYELLNLERETAVIARATKGWGLTQEQAKALVLVSLEDKYAAHSRVALHKLVARMEDGTRFGTAKKALYGELRRGGEVMDLLPPVLASVKELRNPAVCRSLTELRKVVNGVIRCHGKPAMIRVELARDLKRGREERKEISDKNRKREAMRTKALKEIISKSSVREPSRMDVEKFLLAEECNWICPYTGQPITPGDLFGEGSPWDVEHIIPFSKSLDNSFANKTLCWADFNRHHKKNRSPMEAFHTDSQAWQDVLSRLNRFQGESRFGKIRRFQMTPEEVKATYEDFTQRHLADTRYASRLASGYLGQLYGGEIDAKGVRRVQASSGGVTAFLRGEWELNGLLGGGGQKTRKDHRHHAVDAAVIAMSSPSAIKALSEAASRGGEVGRRLFAAMRAPWAELQDQMREHLDRLVVSHRVDHRIAGPLHAETNYSRAIQVKTQKQMQVEQRHVRKPLVKLSKAEVERIVDTQVRQAVQAVLNGGEPKNVFKDVERAAPGDKNLPCLKAKDGRLIPIRKVRIKVNENPSAVGRGARTRHVTSGKDTLHHMVIVEEHTKRGERWISVSVDRMEVYRRLREGEPIIQRDWGDDRRFVMAIHKGDCIEMADDKGNRNIYIVKSACGGDSPTNCDIEFRLPNDARLGDEIKAAGERSTYRIRSSEKLRERRAVVVSLSPIGEVRTS